MSRPLARALGALATLALPLMPTPLAAQGGEELQGRLDQWFTSTTRRTPGGWGIAVADQQGRVLWSVAADQPMVPASTVKLLTTGFARSVVGGDSRRSTRVTAQGALEPQSGTWLGSWALELNGDPSFERDGGEGARLADLARQLRAAGVRRLAGPLQLQSAEGPTATAYPAVWSPKHRGRLFAPPIGPVTLHENVVWIGLAPGRRAGQPVRVVGAMPAGVERLVKVAAKTRGGRASRLSFRPVAGGWVVTGTLGVRSGSVRLASVAHEPVKVLAAAWRTALAEAGIRWDEQATVPAPVQATPRVLAAVASPTFDSLASEINRRSLNVGAELLLRWAGGAAGPAAAAEKLTRHVQEISGIRDGVRLVDGSGLSYDDRVTPLAFVKYLARYPLLPNARNFSALLPANGSGTLRRLASGFPAAGVVRAKTGTLDKVSTLVGYLGRPDGVLLVALMYNGPRPWDARQAQWDFFRQLGADGVVVNAEAFDASRAGTNQLGGEPQEQE